MSSTTVAWTTALLTWMMAAVTDARDSDRQTSAADPYHAFRGRGHARIDFGLGEFPLFVGYDDVRAAARDWQTFTSDTPFEVPIPPEHGLRPVRQLPIETDPPDHTDYRAVTARFFTRSAADRHAPVIADVVDGIIETALARGALDVTDELALPVVNHGLAALLGRPADEAKIWLRWGVHVFHSGSGDERAGGRSANEELNDYLEQVVDDARKAPGTDFFGALAGATYRGRPLTRDEMLGFGNLVFAGGRDTVVKAIAAICWYVASHPDEWARLRRDRSLVRTAIEEILRLASPLPFIGRHATAPCHHAGADIDAGDLVALGFAAANRDPAVFEAADKCRLDRHPNRHIAFGHGPHTCSGAHLARMELRVTLERLLERTSSIELASEPRHATLTLAGATVPFGIENVRVRLHRR